MTTKHTTPAQTLIVEWDNGNVSHSAEYKSSDAWATVQDLIKAPNCFSCSVYDGTKLRFHFEDGKIVEGNLPEFGVSL